jgi:hypothetical protein
MEYSNNDILFENEKYLAIKSPNMEEGLKVGPEFLTTTRHGKDVYNNRTVYFFIDKEEKDTRYGIVTLAFGEYFEVYDNYGDDVELRDVFYYFPVLDKTITDIVGGVDLITTLTLIENGKEFDRWKLQRLDSNIKYVQYNQKRPKLSKIYLTFDSSEGILEFLGFPDDVQYHIKAVLNPYGYGGEIWGDHYRMVDEWNEGYMIQSFNDENRKLVDKIVGLIKPEFFNWKDDEHIREKLCKLLYEMFDSRISNIISEYGTVYERAGSEALKKELIDDFCNPFVENNIQIFVVKNYCFYEYRTWVSYLKELLIQYRVDTIEDLVKRISEDHINADLGHEINEYPYYGNIDEESFNREVESELEKIIDQIEGNPEKYSKNASENGKLVLILKKYPLNEPFSIDDGRGLVTITGIKDGRLLVTHIKTNGERTNKSFNSEEFYNFIAMGELFEDLVRKLKRML